MSTAAFVLGAAGAEQLTRLKPALGAVVLVEPQPDAAVSRSAVKRPRPHVLLTTFNLQVDSLPRPRLVLTPGSRGPEIHDEPREPPDPNRSALRRSRPARSWRSSWRRSRTTGRAASSSFSRCVWRSAGTSSSKGSTRSTRIYVGPTETNRPFSSEPYFRKAPGPVAAYMRKQFDDPAATIADQVKADEGARAAEFAKLCRRGASGGVPGTRSLKQLDDMLEKATRP